MKKVFVILVGLLVAGLVSAAPLCTTTNTIQGATGIFSLSNAAPGVCFAQQDKLYGDFNWSGVDPTQVALIFSYQPLGNNDNHTVTFSGTFNSAFTIGYEVDVNTVLAPHTVISSVAVDILSATGGTVMDTLTGNNFSAITATGGSRATTGLPPLSTSAIVLNTYNPNGGGSTGIANTFVESIVPEPMSLLLSGGGLLAIGLIGRKLRKS
jgi:hypothetical protein